MSTNFTNSLEKRKNINPGLLYQEEVYQIIACALEVHKTLGAGFLEAVYQEALEREFVDHNIPFESQKPLRILYKGSYLEKQYQADFVLFGKIILEIKAIDNLDSNHLAQVLNYLKVTQFHLGLLVNFGARSLEWKRVVS